MSLTTKALLTAASRFLTITLNIISQFILIPLIAGGLGDVLYGIYVLINRASGMISFADLRSSACLRYVLAQNQAEKIWGRQNKYITASLVVAVIFSPVILLACGVIILIFPKLYDIPQQYLVVALIGIALIGVRIVLQSILTIPTAVLRGNNLEYKLWWINIVNIIGVFALMYIAIKLNWGIVGLISAPIAASIVVGFFALVIMKREFPWVRLGQPEGGMVREMSGHGSWYMLNSLALQVYQSADVLILGMVTNLQTVAYYSICKAMMFRASESLANLFGAPAAGLGELIGSNNNEAVIRAREHLLRMGLLTAALVGGEFLALNKYFILLWMSEYYYLGNTINLVLVCGAVLLLFSAVDEMLLNCILQFKVRFCIISTAVAVMVPTCYFLAYYWGVIGVAVGLLIGKSVFTVNSFIFISRRLGISGWQALYPLLNTLCAVIALFIIIYSLSVSFNLTVDNWWEFIAAVIVVGAGILVFLTVFGVSTTQRKFYVDKVRSRYPALPI